MNIILVKHPDSAKLYCFSVPDHLATSVRRGSKVICNTARGMKVGIAMTGVITGDGAEDVAKLHCAHFPLAEIDSVLVSIPMDEIEIPDYIANKYLPVYICYCIDNRQSGDGKRAK